MYNINISCIKDIVRIMISENIASDTVTRINRMRVLLRKRGIKDEDIQEAIIANDREESVIELEINISDLVQYDYIYSALSEFSKFNDDLDNKKSIFIKKVMELKSKLPISITTES